MRMCSPREYYNLGSAAKMNVPSKTMCSQYFNPYITCTWLIYFFSRY